MAHGLIHQNEGAFVQMRLSLSVQNMPSLSHTHKTLVMPLHMSTVSSHIMDHCETDTPGDCCMSGTVDACLSSHETTPLLLRCSRLYIPSHHHYKQLCHCKCPHNNGASRKSVCEEEMGVVTHATQMITVLSSCQSHHHCVYLVFHNYYQTETHCLCWCCSFCNDLCGMKSATHKNSAPHPIHSTPFCLSILHTPLLL